MHCLWDSVFFEEIQLSTGDKMKMKGKRVIAGILFVGIIAGILAGCKNTDDSKKKQKSRSLHLEVTIIHHIII
jgi:hypothetical protein